MPMQLRAPRKSGIVCKRDQEVKPGEDMAADVNLSPSAQVLGPEEQDELCEVSRGSPRDSCLEELLSRHRK